MCMCMCVCERERERESGRGRTEDDVEERYRRIKKERFIRQEKEIDKITGRLRMIQKRTTQRKQLVLRDRREERKRKGERQDIGEINKAREIGWEIIIEIFTE